MIQGQQNYTHSPWARTFKCHPELYVKPGTVEQVIECVKYCVSNKKNLVVTGATHSPSIITKTSGVLMSLDKLNKVLNFEKHAHYTDVTVEAGIRLKDVNEQLFENGLALQNLGSISEQSVAGVISTGTHGSSYLHGLISEQIVSLDVVLETGEVKTLSDQQNTDLFKAVLLGLGSFGIIVRATLRTIPAFNVESRAFVVDFDKLLTNEVFSKVFVESEFHRIWWYPYANKCYVWQADKTSKAEEPPFYYFSGTKLGRFLYQALLYLAIKFRPSLTPAIERWLFSKQFDSSKVTRHVGRSYNEINMDCLFKQYVNEWVFKLSDGPKVLKELRTEILKEDFYVHSPIEIRASNTTLPTTNELDSVRVGPYYGNITRPLLDPSPKLEYAVPKKTTNAQLNLNLNATIFRPFGCNTPHDKWFKVFEEVCAKYGGKPHWAKNFISNPWTKEELSEFVKLRGKYAGKGVFGGVEWLEMNKLTN